jgi:hypothetical protein
MRLLGVSLAIAVIVYVVTAGHVVFLPLLFVPLGILTLGGRRRSRRRRLF